MSILSLKNKLSQKREIMTRRLSPPLITDLYQLTMAHAYWQQGRLQDEGIFHAYFRRAPFGLSYAIAAGLDPLIEAIQDYRFTVPDIQYLGGLRGADGKPLFGEGFLNYLQRMELQCDIDAIPEGTIVRPDQPLVRVRGPLIQAQLLETLLLNILNFQTLIASQAARIVAAAQEAPVLEFGLRRAQGIDGGMSASRAAYIGGCAGTSNVAAGQRYGIPVKGTHAHSWVMAHDSELEAFRAFAAAMPNNCILLVDTYDTLQGVQNAITIARELQMRGQRLLGIRLDSGDLAALSQAARQLLDAAGLHEVQIVASDSLDATRIRELIAQGAAIDSWGVGTQLVTAAEQPALGGVYKLASYRLSPNAPWRDTVKCSETAEKSSLPGCLNVRRYYDDAGTPIGDLIYDEHAERSDQLVTPQGTRLTFRGATSRDLLQPVYRSGALVYARPSLADIRRKATAERCNSRLTAPEYAHGLCPTLLQKKSKLVAAHQTAGLSVD